VLIVVCRRWQACAVEYCDVAAAVSILVQTLEVGYSAQVVVNLENNNVHLMRDGGHPGCLVPSLSVAAATNPNIDFISLQCTTHSQGTAFNRDATMMGNNASS
jgi:hypothetical protein